MEVVVTNGGNRNQRFRGQEEVEVLQAELRALQAKVSENESTLLSLRSQLSQKNDQLSFLTDEKIVGEEALEASQRECTQLTSLIKELDTNIAQLTTALATRTKERDAALSAEKREVEVRLVAEAQLQEKCKSLECQLQAALEEQKRLQDYIDESKNEGYQKDLMLARSANEVQEQQIHVQSAEKEINDLKSLVTQLDQTREKLVEKLQHTMIEYQLVENQLAKTERELRRLTEESEVKNTEMLHLHTLLEAASKDRDHLETELRIHLETFMHLKDENKRLEADALVIKKDLQKAEQALQEEILHVQQADAKIMSLKEQLAVEEASRRVFEERCVTNASELQHLREDLTRMTCEQQLLKSESRQIIVDRDNLMEELKSMESKLTFSDQVLFAKEKEEKEMMFSYQKLCDEYQKLKLALIEMDTQARQLKFQLQSTEELHFVTQERARSLDEELQKCKTDLKNMERECEKLSRSVNHHTILLEDCQKEKSALSAHVVTFRQVATEMEQKYENISRDMGALEAQNRILTDVLQERAQEIEAISARYRLEQEHVREVEKLLTCVRAQEHQRELETKETETKNSLMKERLASLEEQAKMLQATRDSQNKEIMRLQARLQNRDSPERSSSGLSFAQSLTQYDLKELETQNAVLTADLSKASGMYKDCLERLQHTEAQCAQQKKDYDHMLELLAKVDEERTLLQRKCGELLAKISPKSKVPGVF